ncbi:MAG: cytidylate kinase family protein [Acidobacteria bacterium]|nr:cytidylate kinase family protein [Acidobacteriota bacterium]
MAFLTVSGEPGCRPDEVARIIAQRLGFEHITEARIKAMLREEFGENFHLPEKAWPHMVAFILARLARESHLVISAPGAELLFKDVTDVLRVQVMAPESRRIGTLMLDRRLERTAAREELSGIEKQQRQERMRRFGRSTISPHQFDLLVNAGTLESEQIAELVEAAARMRGLPGSELLSAGAEAQLQFQSRLQLARHKIAPPGKVALKRAAFVHPSEEIFANLLDFYRIPWEYEPRSFPIQWDKEGRVSEAFTPDFYLPEFDLYVELTTMKQSLVTKKNRKVKLVRQMYPHVNIQVFYQKDIQNLIFKYGLGEARR